MPSRERTMHRMHSTCTVHGRVQSCAGANKSFPTSLSIFLSCRVHAICGAAAVDRLVTIDHVTACDVRARACPALRDLAAPAGLARALHLERTTKFKTTKIYSGDCEGLSTNICTPENNPLYGILYAGSN